MKLLAVETESMWPPVIDKMTVEKGYEIALGAALGDDLDAPVDQSHAMRWMGAAVDPSDPALPDGVQAACPICAGAARAGAASRPDRRDRARRWRAACRPAQARPAPGFARRRSLALGRLCRRRACADRRRAPARATQPPVRHRWRNRIRPHHARRQAQGRRGGAIGPDRGRSRRSRRTRALAHGAARGRQRPRTPRHGRARNGAQHRAHLCPHRGEDKTDRRPRRGPRQPGRCRKRPRRTATVRRPGAPARRHPLRDRRQARAARRGARRSAGAGARGRARRPAAHRHRHRPPSLERPQRSRRRADRHARHPQRRGQAGARSRWPTRRRSSRRSAAC